MKTFYVPVSWTSEATFEVEAESVEEASEVAEEYACTYTEKMVALEIYSLDINEEDIKWPGKIINNGSS